MGALLIQFLFRAAFPWRDRGIERGVLIDGPRRAPDAARQDFGTERKPGRGARHVSCEALRCRVTCNGGALLSVVLYLCGKSNAEPDAGPHGSS